MADYEALAVLYRQTDEYHARIEPRLMRVPDGPSRPPSLVQSVTDDPESALLVAEGAGGALLGTLIVRLSKPWSDPRSVPLQFAEVSDLVVTERAAHQCRQGVDGSGGGVGARARGRRPQPWPVRQQ